MLRFSSLIFVILLLTCSCKSRKDKLMSSQSEKKIKVIKHKIENSDFLYNTDSDEALVDQYKQNKKKRKELEKYQPSRRTNELEFEKKKKKTKAPRTYY